MSRESFLPASESMAWKRTLSLLLRMLSASMTGGIRLSERMR